MSAEPDVHADCIRQDEDVDSPYPLDRTVDRRVRASLETLKDREAEGGLNDICDEANELVAYILDQPSPHARYAAMVAVIGNLLAEAAPPPIPYQGDHAMNTDEKELAARFETCCRIFTLAGTIYRTELQREPHQAVVTRRFNDLLSAVGDCPPEQHLPLLTATAEALSAAIEFLSPKPTAPE